MYRFLPVLLLLLSGRALAEDLLIESEPFIARSDAVALHSQVSDALPEGSTATVRLVRRFHQGQGWRYLVVIEGASSQAEADTLAALGAGLEIHQSEGTVQPAPEAEALPVAAPDTVQATADGEPVAVTEPQPSTPPGERMLAAEGVLRAAVRAHGGREGAGVLVAEAESIRFSYTRTVPEATEPLVVNNHFLRKGGALRLEVEITSGAAVNSTTILTTDQVGWVTVDGEHTERDSERTLEILERFSPEAVLAVPLGFPDDVETAGVWRELETVDRRGEGEEALWILQGLEESSLQEAAFGVQQRLLRQVTWSSSQGDITFSYDDYQLVEKDLLVPFHTRIERDGEMIEEITVLTFEVDPVIADDQFAAPE